MDRRVYKSWILNIEFGGFALVVPGGQLNHPDPKVGVVDVKVVGDTPHYDQVHLPVKETYEGGTTWKEEIQVKFFQTFTPCSSSSQAKVPDVPVKLVSLLFTWAK